MGYAIQQGSTCTVAAINEYLDKGTVNRFKSLIETALWVLIGELFLFRLGWANLELPIWQISTVSILGAMLLGLGAYINGACAVGTIARIGNAEWDYFITIIGFFCGALLLPNLHLDELHPTAIGHTSIPNVPDWLLIILGCLLAYRAWQLFQKGLHPYFLTVVVGIFFLALLVFEHAWSYTDLLVDIAQLKDVSYLPRVILFITFLGGAVWGGRNNRKSSPKKIVTKHHIIRRFIGGAAIGFATGLLPGSHDSLILLYMPMLILNAWLGFIVIVATIFAARSFEKHLQKQR
jgi:toxin CptA